MEKPDEKANKKLIKYNEPLTLEQLRNMAGKPVFVHVIDHTVFANKADDFDAWGLCRKSWVTVWDEKRADIVRINYDFDDYGKTWIAFAYPPIKIDREAWVPCLACTPNCSWCKNYHQEIAEANNSICRECKHYSNYEPEYDFCCACGRPLTLSAWGMLRKRLSMIIEI